MTDKAEGEIFNERMNNIMVSGFVAMGISTGTRLGLFDLMTKFKSPVSVSQIAQEAGMKDRYIKEWLGIMVTAKIFDISEDGELYFFPPHHHETLAGPAVVPALSLGLPVWGEVFEDLNECFMKDGPSGLSYERLKNFNHMIDKFCDHKNKANPNYSIDIVKAVPGMIEKLEKGLSVLEVGCGKADDILQLASRFPNSKFLGLDYQDGFLEPARLRAKKEGYSNIAFQAGDAASLPQGWTEQFDYIFTRIVIHDLARPDLALSEIFRVLKPDGIYSILDEKFHTNQADNVSNPFAPPLYSVSLFYCMTTSLHFENGWGLGACWGVEKAKEMLSTAGFEVVVDTKPPGPNDSDSMFHFVCHKKSSYSHKF